MKLETDSVPGPTQIVSSQESSKLLPWLMLIAVLSGVSLGISVGAIVLQNQSESRTRIELDREYRFLQELRIRVEDAELAAQQVNPNFKPIRQPKDKEK